MGLQNQFTQDLRASWEKVVKIVSENMISTNYEEGIEVEQEDSSISPQDIKVIRETWSVLASRGEEAIGVYLFRQIFTIAPEALQMFPFRNEPNTYDSPALKKHATGVVRTLGTAINGLENLPLLAPKLKELGLRHLQYGVVPSHYPVVGKALLNTIEYVLDSKYNSQVERAWKKVIGVVA